MLYDPRFDLTPVETTRVPQAPREPRPDVRRGAARGVLLCHWVLTEAGTLEMRWTQMER